MGDGKWQELLDSQDGVVTSEQARLHGFSSRAIWWRTETGQWLRVLQGVLVVTNGALTRQQILRAALLYGGEHALLSHFTAAEEWGMAAKSLGTVHITVRYGASSRRGRERDRLVSPRPTSSDLSRVHPGVIVHRSRAIAHIGVDAELPRTSAADTVIDLVQSAPDGRLAMRAAVEAMSSARVLPATMRYRLERRPPRRYGKVLLETLNLLESGVHSVLEHRYVVDVEDAHGLPNGTRQAPTVVDGRIVFEDIDYSTAGVPLIVRLDGQQFHMARQKRFKDRRRDNAAEMAGRPRLSYGWEDVAYDPCGVFQEVREVLVREGWADTSVRCRHCL